MKQRNFDEQFEFENKYHQLILNENNPIVRQRLYKEAYTKLYSSFFNKKTELDQFGAADHYLKILNPLLSNKIFVDIGCGTGSSLAYTSKHFPNSFSIGLEVDQELVNRINNRIVNPNSIALCFDGLFLPFKSNTIDIVYSNNVLEHLHPDDALVQIDEIHRILKPGGIFLCITPTSWNGPHDISKYKLRKGEEPQGLHLHEYSITELFNILDQNGFKKVTQSWISPDRLCKFKMHKFFAYLQRGQKTNKLLDTQFVRNHGILHGTFCFDKIVMTATK